jgi:hypothetical protein
VSRQALTARRRRVRGLARRELLRLIKRAEDGIRGDLFETAIVFDVHGREILRKPGQQYEISFTNSELAFMQGAILTHSHPRGWSFPATDPRRQGSSFSLADVELAASHGLLEIRAVSPAWRYSMRPGRVPWDRQRFTDDIEPGYRQAEAEVLSEFRQAILDGRMTAATAESRYYHEIWSRVARRLGLTYQREGT